MPKESSLLIFDLDETLIHTTYQPLKDIPYVSNKGYFYLYERPYLSQFLEMASNNFDFAIWSASKAIYVRWVINSTALSNYDFKFIFTRKNCLRRFNNLGHVQYEKNLLPMCSGYDRILMLDDFPQMVNPISFCRKISEFKGDINDVELKDLISTLL